MKKYTLMVGKKVYPELDEKKDSVMDERKKDASRDEKKKNIVMDEKEVERIIDECLRMHFKVYDRLAEI